MEPQLSIVIPMYNNEAFIAETLDSILAQSAAHWECLMVDDGSTDNTLKLADKYVSNDPRFKCLSRPETAPKGANSCRNLGLQQARADWVIFLDADDVLLPNALEDRLKAVLEFPNYEAYVFSFRSFSEQGAAAELSNSDPQTQSVKEYLKAFLSYQIPWQTSCPMWKREFVLNQGGFDPDFQRFQDVEFHTRMLLNGAQIKRIHKEDFRYRVESQTNKYRDPEFMETVFEAVFNYLKKFSSNRSNISNSLMSVRERKSFLREMLRKLADTFVIPGQYWNWMNRFVNLGTKTGLLSTSQGMAFGIYARFQRTGWHKKKGLGLYRIYSWSKRKSGLKSELNS